MTTPPPDGRPRVLWRWALVLSVADNGPGIPAHLQAKAFDLFQRLGAAQSTPGAGVGLSMCQKIAELHGGSMAMDPDYEGGLRYLIRLPAALRKTRVRPVKG